MATKIPLDSFHDDPRGRRVDHAFGMLTIDDNGRRRFAFRYCEDGCETEATALEAVGGFNVQYTYTGDRNASDLALARVEQHGPDEWVLYIDGNWRGKPFAYEITALRRPLMAPG